MSDLYFKVGSTVLYDSSIGIVQKHRELDECLIHLSSVVVKVKTSKQKFRARGLEVWPGPECYLIKGKKALTLSEKYPIQFIDTYNKIKSE